MAEIKAFQALRYNPRQFGKDLSVAIAPPYDVLDAKDKAALLRKSEQNIVAVDLPFIPPKSAGPDQLYADAAALLHRWEVEGSIIQESGPALYVYHQIYSHAGRQYTRKMFLARMRLEPFGEGTVFPHEQTFGGPKEDRLKLMQATRCQLSPVFGLYNDPGNVVSGLLNVDSREPDITAELEGVLHRMWVLQDLEVVQAVSSVMQDRAVYIADGHHRYGTALTYKEWLTARTGPLALDHPAQFVLIGLCAMEDPGCIILPTHRVLSGFNPQQVMPALEKGLRLRPVTAKDPAFTDGGLKHDSADDVAVYVAAGDHYFLGTFTQRKVLEELAPERSPAWRKLDLAYLHRYLIDELITKQSLGGNPPTIHYIKSAADAIQDARQTNGICILTKPCTMDELRDVSQASDLMPQKSTYFYPKLATGLVIHPLEVR